MRYSSWLSAIITASFVRRRALLTARKFISIRLATHHIAGRYKPFNRHEDYHKVRICCFHS